MTAFITQKKGDEFHIVGSSDKCHDLAEILIKAFEKESSHSRELLINNAFMVGLQIKLELGEEVYASLSQYDKDDWEAAWILFNDHNWHKRVIA